MPTTKRQARKINRDAVARIGQTKTVGDTQYRFNKNYRWERVDSPGQQRTQESDAAQKVLSRQFFDKRIINQRGKIIKKLVKPLIKRGLRR